jgi:hypothetical protein
MNNWGLLYQLIHGLVCLGRSHRLVGALIVSAVKVDISLYRRFSGSGARQAGGRRAGHLTPRVGRGDQILRHSAESSAAPGGHLPENPAYSRVISRLKISERKRAASPG